MRKDKVREYLLKAKRGQIAQGLKADVPSLDSHLRFKRGNFNVVIGHANVGKTTVILYLMMLYTLKNGLRWFLYSSENLTEGLYWKLVEFYLCKPIQKMEDAEIDFALEFVYKHFHIMNPDKLYTYSDLLVTFKSAYELEGYDGFLIDPYNSLTKDGNLLRKVGGHEYDYQVASEFRMFCKENNTALYLNAHCHTDALRKKHPKGHLYEGQPVPPEAADVEGGGKWVNRADDVVCIHRYIYHPDDWMISDLHVKKVKVTETGGLPTSMEDPIRMRMVRNNCGFEIVGQNPIKPPELKTVPF